MRGGTSVDVERHDRCELDVGHPLICTDQRAETTSNHNSRKNKNKTKLNKTKQNQNQNKNKIKTNIKNKKRSKEIRRSSCRRESMKPQAANFDAQ